MPSRCESRSGEFTRGVTRDDDGRTSRTPAAADGLDWSQLRLRGLPFGPGELCLGAWIVLWRSRNLGTRSSPATLRIMFFWVAFTLPECFGTLFSLAAGEDFDSLAYSLLAVVSCLTVAGTCAAERLRPVAGWLWASARCH
jgi:hypothetical protein